MEGVNNILQKLREHALIASLFLLMLANLIYMHYEVFLTHYECEKSSLYRSLLFEVIDVLFVTLIFYLITFGKRKVALFFSYLFLLIIEIANIFYSRYFAQYLTIDALCEASNFKGTWWLEYLKDIFRWSDIILVLTTALFFYLFKKIKLQSLTSELAVYVILFMVAFFAYIKNGPKDDNFGWGKDELLNPFLYEQECTIFKNGIIRGQLYCNIFVHSHNHSYTEQELDDIKNYITIKGRDELPLADTCLVRKSPNVVFIIVESLISDAMTYKIGEDEVTPYLNRVISEDGAYCNYEMKSQRGAGQSSDAQISYFTGLIPLSSEMSVSYIVRDSIIGLPALLREKKGYNTYITLPTPPYFWHQNEVNAKYGISTVLQCKNEFNPGWANDEEVFRYLRDFDMKEPFFNVVLTTSMHGPYSFDYLGIYNEESPLSYPEGFPEELHHYLDRCNYTDRQIGKYIDYLKQNGMYNNTLIIIVSDHPADGIPNMYERSLPLVIVNSGIAAEQFESGPINQIDLYPTMLDMFGIASRWRGAGYSILREDYSCEVTQESMDISSKIQRGNYFAK